MTRATSDPAGGQSGFALLLVIWGIGLIALIASSLTVVERYRLQAAANLVNNGEAEALAEAAIGLGRLFLAAEFQGRRDRWVQLAIGGAPSLCALPTGGATAITVEDEGGKVDLNAASPNLIQALLRGVGADRTEADRITAAIAAFRQRPTSDILADAKARTDPADPRATTPKQAAFETILELD